VSCIFGMVGKNDVASTSFWSIKQLEYRPYDSFGFGILNSIGIDLRKDLRTFRDVACRRDMASVHGSLGIAHLRHAIHEKISRKHSQPHLAATETLQLDTPSSYQTVASWRNISKSEADISSTLIPTVRLSFIYSKNCPRERILLEGVCESFALP
jgi:glutamine phosphoribosylpyrophosphate amidotransferase